MSDFEPGGRKTWEHERRILAALARQDIEEHFDVLLVLDDEYREAFSAARFEVVPDLRIIFLDERQSTKLKDHGVYQTTSKYIAVLEADCVPCREWLRLLVHVLRTSKDISVVSGRTNYGDDTTLKRSLNLIDRGFDDLGDSGLTIRVSNNGALYRRSVLEQFPYPDAITPFLSSRLRNHSMRQAGHRFHFERRAVMEHALGGWNFIRDLRRNSGYADMMGHDRIRFSAIPKLLYKRWAHDVTICRRLGSQYLRPYDWPLTIFLLFFARFLEVPGMLDAISGRDRITKSSYR